VISKRERGARFEDMACSYLTNKGYRILERNVYIRRKELDIVALDRDTVVFVEVKGRKSMRYGSPAEAVGGRKQQHMVALAKAYLKRAGLWGRPCRFDVVSVIGGEEGRARMDHIVNAFEA